MKRNSNRLPQDRDLDIGSRPVETRQDISVSKQTEVKIPRAQAVWVAIPLSVAVIVTILSPIAIGPYIFYAVTGVVALAAFLWSLVYEMTWQDRATLPLLTGIVAWCFWRFADFVGWRVPPRWQNLTALLSVGSLVFWWTFTAAMWLTMWQRLGMPMYHQQYSVWKAVGALIEYRGKIEPNVVMMDSPVAQQITFEFKQPGGKIRHNVQPPVDYETTKKIAFILQEKPYNYDNLCGPGKPLKGGEPGREQLREMKEWLIHWKLLEWKVSDGNGGGIATSGVRLTENGERWVLEVVPEIVKGDSNE